MPAAGRGMSPDRPPTLEAVAARAGVSRATASRVLRGQANVSDSARESVQRAAAELSYAPNLAARALVTRRSGSVGFAVTEPENRLFTDPYFAGVLRGAQRVLAAADVQLLFAMPAGAEQESRFLSYVAGRHLDGVLLVSLHGEDELPDRIDALDVPVVVNGLAPPGSRPGVSWVDADNRGGARAAVEHLIERGCRRIATVTGPADMGAGQDRLRGYRDALGAAGRVVEESLVIEGDFSVDGGTAAARRLLADVPDVDGVFAANDLSALGVLRALRAAGRSVPGDVRVVGFDDQPVATHADPALTTVRQPIERLGSTMAETMLARLAGHDTPVRTELPVELVVRDSS